MCILCYQNAASEDSDQTARMRRRIWIFDGHNVQKYISDVSVHKIPLMQFLLTKCDKACPLDNCLLYHILFQYFREQLSADGNKQTQN